MKALNLVLNTYWQLIHHKADWYPNALRTQEQHTEKFTYFWLVLLHSTEKRFFFSQDFYEHRPMLLFERCWRASRGHSYLGPCKSNASDWAVFCRRCCRLDEVLNRVINSLCTHKWMQNDRNSNNKRGMHLYQTWVLWSAIISQELILTGLFLMALPNNNAQL